jgi:hypothetical protein
MQRRRLATPGHDEQHPMTIAFEPPMPLLRIFSVEKAFYVDFLGFRMEWEQRFEDGRRSIASSEEAPSSSTSRSIMATRRPGRPLCCG